MTVRITHGEAAVDQDYFWRDMESCPIGCKIQLLNPDGVAVYGCWNGKDTWPQGWAPLPKIRRRV